MNKTLATSLPSSSSKEILNSFILRDCFFFETDLNETEKNLQNGWLARRRELSRADWQALDTRRQVLDFYFSSAQVNLFAKKQFFQTNDARLLLLCSIVDDAFGDTDLECDTKTPGCERMCINHFYPLKPQSYWSIQMLFISLPIMIFMVYTRSAAKLRFNVEMSI